MIHVNDCMSQVVERGGCNTKMTVQIPNILMFEIELKIIGKIYHEKWHDECQQELRCGHK